MAVTSHTEDFGLSLRAARLVRRAVVPQFTIENENVFRNGGHTSDCVYDITGAPFGQRFDVSRREIQG